MIGSLLPALLLCLAIPLPLQDGGKKSDDPPAAEAEAEAIPADEAPSSSPEQKTAPPSPKGALDVRRALIARERTLIEALRLDVDQWRELRRLLELELDRYLAAMSLRNGGGPGKAEPGRKVSPRAGARKRSGPPAGAGKAPARGGAGAKRGAKQRPPTPPGEEETADPPGPARGRGVLPEKKAAEESAPADPADAPAADAPVGPGAPGPMAPEELQFGVLIGPGVHPALRGLRLTTLSALLRILKPEQIPTFGRMLGDIGVLQLRQLATYRRLFAPRVPLKAGKAKKAGGAKKRGGRKRGGKRRGGRRP